MAAWALLSLSASCSLIIWSNCSSAVGLGALGGGSAKFDGPALPVLPLAGGLNIFLESVGILSLSSLNNDLESVGKSALLIGSCDSVSHLLLLTRGVVARIAAGGASTPDAARIAAADASLPEAGATPRCLRLSSS